MSIKYLFSNYKFNVYKKEIKNIYYVIFNRKEDKNKYKNLFLN